MKKLEIDKKNAKLTVYIAIITGLLMTSISLYGNALRENNNLVNHSATRIGATAIFSKTTAKATITNYYTDQNKDVLIARIALNQDNKKPMPYKATDYLVLQLQNGAQTRVPLIFGRVGTDGDLFVIIPKPDPNKVYKIAIINYNYLGDSISVNTTNDTVDLDNQSIAKALSNASDLTNLKKKNDDTLNNAKDSVIFQFTLNPAVKTKEYQTETLDIKTFWSKNKQKEMVFNFKEYWELVYKKPLVTDTQNRLKEITETISRLQEQLQEAEDTLSKNPKDAPALSKKSSLESQIENQQEIQKEQSKNLKHYRSLRFDSSDFDDYLTSVSTYAK